MASAAEAHPCTIVARNYLPFARVLARSYRAHHPGSGFTVLLIDDDDCLVDDAAEPFEVMRLDALGLTRHEAHRRGLLYSATELATSVKALFLRQLLQGHEVVAYFDPDIVFYAPVPEVSDLAAEHGIVLTPHTLSPMRRDGLSPGEADILQEGVYNLGFISVSSAAKECLDWWAERLARGSFHDPANMMFLDQRWIDFVPAFFPHALLKDPGCNVAYWNLDQRQVRRAGGGFEVDGVPLRFFHFSGYDPHEPWLLSKHQGPQPRVLLSVNPTLRQLCDEYGLDLLAAGFDRTASIEYGFARLADGTVVEEVVRAAYRAAVTAAEARSPGRQYESAPDPAESAYPPDPFDPGRAHDFTAWLTGPGDGHPNSAISRYLETLWGLRPDLQQAFPDPHGRDARAYTEWAAASPELNLSVRLVERSVAKSRARMRVQDRPCPLQPGVNVVGYLQGEFGLGESARSIVAALSTAGVPYQLICLPAPCQRHQDLSCVGTSPARLDDEVAGYSHPGVNMLYDITLLCANADATPSAVGWLGEAAVRKRYTIGMWYWELEQFPPFLHRSFSLVDEVWAASDFVRRSVAAHTDKPVRRVSPALRVPETDPELTRADFGLPTRGYLFLFVFDFLSVPTRKNALGLLKAYRAAFQPDDGATLVLKGINSGEAEAAAEELRLALAGQPDVILLEETMRPVEKNSLIGMCDAYVSLHRSEGFGLTMAEAMALGKPVIATGYSGSREFMNRDNSFLVPYVMTEVPPGADPYPVGYRWAEPDLRAASMLMRYVRADPRGAARVAERGRATVLTEHGLHRQASLIRERLDTVRATGAARHFRRAWPD